MFQGINQLLKQLGGPWKKLTIEHDLASHRTHGSYVSGAITLFWVATFEAASYLGSGYALVCIRLLDVVGLLLKSIADI